MLLDSVRIPLIWMEFQVCKIIGAKDFDYTNEKFLDWFYFISFPFIWLLLLTLAPYLILFMPFFTLVFYNDPYLFVDDKYVPMEEYTIDYMNLDPKEVKEA